jgi:antirestriction protein
MIEAYITNLGKYVEGELCGEYLKLPAEKADVQALLARIGVDGILYEETFITDYESDIEGLCRYMGEYESVDELNYLAALLSDMDDGEIKSFEAALVYGEYTSNVKGLINLAQNLDCYSVYHDVENEEDLGHYFVDELCALEIPEHLEPYFNHEAYGRDLDMDISGIFSAQVGGYVEYTGGFTEHYGGRDDLPDEYRIFAYPDPPEKMPIKQQLEMYAKMIAAPSAEKLTPAREERC